MPLSRLVAGSALALVLFLGVAALAYRNISGLLEAQRRVDHTHEVLETVEAVLSLVKDAELAARGYAITAAELYRQHSAATRDALRSETTTLRALTIDTGVQQRRVATLERLVQRKLERIDAMIAARARGAFDEPSMSAHLAPSTSELERIRRVGSRMKDAERKLIARRQRIAHADTRRVLTTLRVGSVLGAGLFVAMTVLLARAILKRARVESAFRVIDERLNLALRSAAVGTWSWDLITDVITWDDYMHPLFGIAPGIFGGRYENAMDLIHADDRERVTREVRAAIDEGTPYETEFRVVWRDGSLHVLGSRGTVYRDGDARAVRMTGVCWDMTARKEAENRLHDRTLQLEAANDALQSFTYSVSHDLRAPLRAIDGYARILIEDHTAHLDGDGQRVLGVICDNARKMGQLIDDLLTFSRLARKDLESGNVDMAALAGSVVDDLRRSHADRDVTVSIGALAPACGDETMIRHVLMNLIGNAWKFTRGRPDATIEIGCTREDGETVYVVNDNGAGFDMAYAPKLFGVFQRLHRADEFEGTGVGLAIVQRIVQRHGGRVWAEGAVGHGATFYFTLDAEGGSHHASEGRGDIARGGHAGGRRAGNEGAA